VLFQAAAVAGVVAADAIVPLTEPPDA
jgi:hypothetical protein